jgi:hypothetical protein
MGNNNMKKNFMTIFAVGTALTVLSGFWGCGSGGDDDETPPAVSVYSGFDSAGQYVNLKITGSGQGLILSGTYTLEIDEVLISQGTVNLAGGVMTFTSTGGKTFTAASNGSTPPALPASIPNDNGADVSLGTITLSGADGSSLPDAEIASLGNIEIEPATGVRVYNENGGAYNPGAEKKVWALSGDAGDTYMNAVVTAGSNITSDGKLTLKLPVFSSYGNWDEITSFHEKAGLTANPSDVKTVYLGSLDVGDGEKELVRRKTSAEIDYLYADKNAVVQGVYVDNGYTGHINMILKKGWNLIIETRTGPSTWTFVTGIPSDLADYKWIVEGWD